MLRDNHRLWRQGMIEKGYLSPGPDDAKAEGADLPVSEEEWVAQHKEAMNAPRQPAAERPRRWRLRHKVGAVLIGVALLAACMLL